MAAYTLGAYCYDRRAVAALELVLVQATDATILRGARWALGRQQWLAVEGSSAG